MNILKCAAFFHDGLIIDIQHLEDIIEFSMVSAEIDEEDIRDDMILFRDRSIQGKLYCEGILSIKINEKPFLGKLRKTYDRGKIFDFEIADDFVELSIDWANITSGPEMNEFSVIQIEARKIWWENIPDLIEARVMETITLKDFIKCDLEFDKTFSYFIDHIDCGKTLSGKVIKEIDFSKGNFFTFLSPDAKNERMYDFSHGGIMPTASIGHKFRLAEGEDFYPRQVITTDEPCSEFIKNYI